MNYSREEKDQAWQRWLQNAAARLGCQVEDFDRVLEDRRQECQFSHYDPEQEIDRECRHAVLTQQEQ